MKQDTEKKKKKNKGEAKERKKKNIRRQYEILRFASWEELA